MIISHQHRYLFVEVPQTATTAVADELCENYAGVPVLHKHASYGEFSAQASEDECSYMVIAGVRHPLDILVSMYEKWRTDHHQLETNTDAEPWQLKRFRWVKANEADFSETVRHFFKSWDVKTPPSNAADRIADYLLRFETVGKDFSGLLERLDIEPVRELPVRNRTDRTRAFEHYYCGLEKQCAAAFGPWSEYWGYDTSFLNAKVPWWAHVVFSTKMALKRHR